MKTVRLVWLLSLALVIASSYEASGSTRSPSLSQDGVSLPAGRAGITYEFRIQTEGGLAPLKWKLVGGQLPPGLELLPSGVIRGVPTSAQREPYVFEVEVSDSSEPPQTFAQRFALVIRAAPLRIVTNPITPTTPERVTAENTARSPLAPNIQQEPRTVESQSSAQVAGDRVENSEAVGSNSTRAVVRSRRSSGSDFTTSQSNVTVRVHGKVILASMKERPTTNSRVRVTQGQDAAEALKRADWDVLNATERKQKLLLENYVSNLIVQAQNASGETVATVLTDTDGDYEFNLDLGTTTSVKYTISTEADDYNTRRTIIVRQNEPVRLDLLIEDRPVSLLHRAVVGFSQAGASSAKNDQNYFFDLYISKPLPFQQKVDPNFGERWRTWGDIRIASVPQQVTTGIGAFAGQFVQNAAGVKVNEIAQALEFLAGVEVRVLGNDSLLPSFDRQTKQKFSLSLVAGFGVTTPTDPRELLELFKVSPNAPGLPPEAIGRDFVAFVPSERDRFFRQYYAGLRLQTFYFNLLNVPKQRFPAMLDLMYGQNEFVTGGRRRGGVIRLDGYFPLPYDGLKFINLFGTALLRPGRATTTVPLILEPAPAGTIIPAPNAVVLTAPQFNRDYYRVGAGIDFISFIQSLRDTGKK